MLEKIKENEFFESDDKCINYFVNLKGSYEYNIIKDININNTIKPTALKTNVKDYFEYNPKEMISYKEFGKNTTLNCRDIINIMDNINLLLTDLKEYNISKNSICLDSDKIFIDKNGKMNFCILPDRNLDFEYELSKFLIRTLRHIDTKDNDALKLAYGLFVRSSKDNYKINDLLELTSIFGDKSKNIGNIKSNEEVLKITKINSASDIRKKYENIVSAEGIKENYNKEQKLINDFVDLIFKYRDDVPFLKNHDMDTKEKIKDYLTKDVSGITGYIIAYSFEYDLRNLLKYDDYKNFAINYGFHDLDIINKIQNKEANNEKVR